MNIYILEKIVDKKNNVFSIGENGFRTCYSTDLCDWLLNLDVLTTKMTVTKGKTEKY